MSASSHLDAGSKNTKQKRLSRSMAKSVDGHRDRIGSVEVLKDHVGRVETRGMEASQAGLKHKAKKRTRSVAGFDSRPHEAELSKSSGQAICESTRRPTRTSARLAAVLDQQYPVRSDSSCLHTHRDEPCTKPCLEFSQYCRVHTEARSEAEFHSAVEEGNVDLIRFLIERKRIDAKIMAGYTQPLARASYLGHEKLVRLLIEQEGAKLDDSDGHTPLWWAAREGHDSMFQFLVRRADIKADGEDIHGYTPLHAAVMHGQTEIVRHLLHREDVDANHKNKNGQTPLWMAARNGRDDVLKLLLDHGASVSVDSEGRTPLHISVRCGHQGSARLLIGKKDIEIDHPNEKGETPLWIAARHGRTVLARLLLLQSANVNKVGGQGQTPLHIAARYGQEAVVRLLLDQKGIEPNCKDENHRTPLWMAACHGQEAVVRTLLKQGVDVNCKDLHGQTPLAVAKNKGVMKLLTRR